MSVLDDYGVRREPEGPNGEVILAVSHNGFAIEGEHDVRYTQDDKGKWTADDGSKVIKAWQEALTAWIAPRVDPPPLAEPMVHEDPASLPLDQWPTPKEQA